MTPEVSNEFANPRAVSGCAAWRDHERVKLLVDGRLLRSVRPTRSFNYSGKHKAQGTNVQVIADPAGRLVWISPALPADIGAAREHGITDALTHARVTAIADTAYQGGGPLIRVSQRRRRRDPDTGHSHGQRMRSTLRTPAGVARASAPTPS